MVNNTGSILIRYLPKGFKIVHYGFTVQPLYLTSTHTCYSYFSAKFTERIY